MGDIGSAGVESVICNDSPDSAVSSVFGIFPNPSNGAFMIKLPTGGMPAWITIYDVLGQRLYNQELFSANNTIYLTNQACGVYLYRVLNVNGGLIGKGKLVVQK